MKTAEQIINNYQGEIQYFRDIEVEKGRHFSLFIFECILTVHINMVFPKCTADINRDTGLLISSTHSYSNKNC